MAIFLLYENWIIKTVFTLNRIAVAEVKLKFNRKLYFFSLGAEHGKSLPPKTKPKSSRPSSPHTAMHLMPRVQPFDEPSIKGKNYLHIRVFCDLPLKLIGLLPMFCLASFPLSCTQSCRFGASFKGPSRIFLYQPSRELTKVPSYLWSKYLYLGKGQAKNAMPTASSSSSSRITVDSK